MGHPRETNLPHDMGLPRPELAGTETRRRIYRGRWGIQGGNWQVGRWEEEFTAGDGTSKGDEFTTWHGTSKAGTGRYGDKKKNLPWEVGHLRWELAGRETGRGIYCRRWDIQGRRIYHMTWDFQGRNWQVRRQEEEFTVGGGASKAGTGR